MKNVHEMTKELVAKEMNLMDSCLKMVKVTDLLDMGSHELELFTNTMSLMNEANDVLVEQSRLLVEINEKLDKLMKSNEK